MSRRESKAKRENKVLTEQVKRTVLKQMLPYISAWIGTLGQLGDVKNPAEDEKTTYQAAAIGLRLVGKFMPEGDDRDGDNLMNDLLAMEKLHDAKTEVPEAFKK